MAALEALCSLFLSCLPSARKLVYFHARPLSLSTPSSTLIQWAAEDSYKNLYFEVISRIEALLADATLPPPVKSRLLTLAYSLLSCLPEQEANLLSLLVNKMGDATPTVSSKAVYLTAQLTVKHPNMKKIVAEEVERVLFRQNANQKV